MNSSKQSKVLGIPIRKSGMESLSLALITAPPGALDDERNPMIAFEINCGRTRPRKTGALTVCHKAKKITAWMHQYLYFIFWSGKSSSSWCLICSSPRDATKAEAVLNDRTWKGESAEVTRLKIIIPRRARKQDSASSGNTGQITQQNLRILSLSHLQPRTERRRIK